MLIRFTLIILSVIITNYSFSQFGIKGVIKNYETTAPVQGATILLKSKTDTTATRTTTSDSSGAFRFTGLQSDSFNVVVSSIGFGTITNGVLLDTASIDLGIIDIRQSADVLAGVTVTATVPLAVQKGDTVQINASQFKVNPDATVEDLAKKNARDNSRERAGKSERRKRTKSNY